MTITKIIPAVIAVRPRGQRGLQGPPGAPGDQINFTTRLAAAASDLDDSVQFVRVSGYATIGDGGGGSCWRRRDTQPTHTAWFQNAISGKYYEYCVEGSINLCHLGAVGDGSTPCDAAMNMAMNLMDVVSMGAARIVLPSGKFVFASKIEKVLTAGTGMFSLRGAGIHNTEICFQNTDGGIHIDRGDFRNGVDLDGFTVTTAQPAGGTAINLTSAAYPTIPGSPWNNISNVQTCGADWRTEYYLESFWNIGVRIKVWGQFNLYNVNTIGNAHPSPSASSGLVFEGNVTDGLYGILYNINQCSFVAHTFGLTYGDWIQGITVNQCNFNGNSGGTAIFSGGGATGILSQLCVSNSQFDFGGSCIALLSAVFDVMLTNNLFGATAENVQLIYMPRAIGFAISNNKIYNFGSNTGMTGIVVGAEGGALGQGVITGNMFKGLDTAVFLASGTSDVVVGLNTYPSCNTKVIDLGTGNSVGTHAVGAMTGVVP